MRKIVCTLLFVCGIITYSNSQDIIHNLNGQTIQAKVLEINSSEIKYKRFDNPDGPTYTVLKSEVQSIQYPNGTSDVFSKPEQLAANNPEGPSKTGTKPADNLSNILGYWQPRPGAIYTGYYYIYSDGGKVIIRKYDLKAQLNTKNYYDFTLTPKMNPDGTTVANVFVFGEYDYDFKKDSVLDVTRAKPRQRFTFVRFTKEELTALNLNEVNQQVASENQQNVNQQVVKSESTSETTAIKKDNDLKAEGLLGKVKEYTIYRYTSANTRDINNLILQDKLVSKFNEDGYFTEMILYNGAGKIDNKAFFTYDQKKNLILKAYYNGNDEKLATSEFGYNEAGLMTESKEIDAEGVVDHRIEYKYNSMGKVTEELTFDGNNAFYGKKTSIYDDNGNVTSEYSSDANGNTVEQFSYVYDKKSRVTRLDAYANNQFNYAFNFEYNSEDKVSLKRHFTSSPSYYSDMIEIKYDKNGNAVSEFSLMTQAKTKRSIEYDAVGNIVKILVIQTDQIPFVEKREYLYY